MKLTTQRGPGLGRSLVSLALVMAPLLSLGCTGSIGDGVSAPDASGAPPAGPRGGGPSTSGGDSSGPATSGLAGPNTPAAGCAGETPSPRLLRQLSRGEYASTVADLFGLTNPDISAIPPDNAVRGFTNNVAAAFVSENHLDAYTSVAGQLASRAVAQSLATLVPCATQDTSCANDFVARFGQRAFRRPLSSEEKARYVRLFDASLTGGDFKVGVELTIKSMLISPHFLFRSELGTDVGGGRFVLSPYEIASALSYTYLGSMPDEPLLTAAANGALAKKAEIETQARRLLQSTRGRERVARFFYEWTEVPRAYVATKEATAFPKLFSDPGGIDGMRDAMRAEQDAFVTNVVFDGSKQFPELFTANYSFVNDRLAAFYGLPAPNAGAGVKKVMFPANSQRGGILTMGMFLFGHARTTASSPTQRGHMVRESLLCENIPPPPPNVDADVGPGTPGKTSRQQILNLTATAECTACHRLMDPIGFGLEGFDAIGAQRTHDNGELVDATGEIVGMTKEGGAPATFDGARELSAILGSSATARGCFAVNYYRFARGFEPAGVDSCAVERLRDGFVKEGLSIPDLFLRVALQDSFVTRRSAEVLEK
jgi:hypothetical protein